MHASFLSALWRALAGSLLTSKQADTDLYKHLDKNNTTRALWPTFVDKKKPPINATDEDEDHHVRNAVTSTDLTNNNLQHIEMKPMSIHAHTYSVLTQDQC